MISLGGKQKNKLFFQLINKYFTYGKEYKVYIAEINGDIAAGLLVFFHKEYIEYFTPVITAKYRPYQALSAIIFTAMVDSINDGRKIWNWGGTWFRNQDGVKRFKERWGTQEKIYNYYTCIKNPSIYDSNPETLEFQYPSFYVIPYNKLKS